MKLSYNNKYKDRNPNETIKIIQDFFNKNNFKIKIHNIQKNDSNTWSAHLKLYFNDTQILTSNGKGLTEEFCLASAHAELYERFCNKIQLLSNQNFNNKIMSYSNNKYGYYFSPNEKIISFEETFNNFIGHYFLHSMENQKNQLKDFFSIIFDDTFIGVPYTNVVSKEQIYLDPRLILLMVNSSGMAAGNNFYEAFNQGMSELYEHIVHSQYYINNQSKYYAIDLNAIQNPALVEIIKTIKEQNDLYIIDLSYNYNIPVLMSLIVNKITHAITINFGSFPVLDIAIERILTELYQGIKSQEKLKNNGQFPFYSQPDYRLTEIRQPGCTMTKTVFPEFIFNKMEMKEQFNTQVFLSNNDYSNEEIFNYILDLNKKLQLDVFYRNNSLTEEMYAIQIFISNFPYLLDNFSFAKQIPDKTNHLLFLLELDQLIKDYLNTGNINFNILEKIIKDNFLFTSDADRYYLSLLQGRKNQFIISLSFASSQNVLEFINEFLYSDKILEENHEIPPFVQEYIPSFYNNLIIYIIIKRYLKQINAYSSKDLLNIFTFLGINNSKDIDASLNNNTNYWLNKIFFTELNKIYNNEYNDYIDIMAKLHWVE